MIAFRESTVAMLPALTEADTVALSGELTPKVYTPRDGSEPHSSPNLPAHVVLTEYHVARKRKAMSDAKAARRPELAAEGAEPELNDVAPL